MRYPGIPSLPEPAHEWSVSYNPNRDHKRDDSVPVPWEVVCGFDVLCSCPTIEIAKALCNLLNTDKE